MANLFSPLISLSLLLFLSLFCIPSLSLSLSLSLSASFEKKLASHLLNFHQQKRDTTLNVLQISPPPPHAPSVAKSNKCDTLAPLPTGKFKLLWQRPKEVFLVGWVDSKSLTATFGCIMLTTSPTLYMCVLENFSPFTQRLFCVIKRKCLNRKKILKFLVGK